MWSLKPKDGEFFDLLEESSRLVIQGAKVLHNLLDDYQMAPAKMGEITEVEHKGDRITQTIIDRLNKTFITPIDREDIFALAQALDDILDACQGTIERMHLYQTDEPSEEMKDLVAILVKSSEELGKAIVLVRNVRKNHRELLEGARFIKSLESEGDRIYRTAVARLFNERIDPIELIKWKEVYEHVEEAVDHCENVAKLLKGVAMKYA